MKKIFSIIICSTMISSCANRITPAKQSVYPSNMEMRGDFISIISNEGDGRSPGIIVRKSEVPDSTIRESFLGTEINVTDSEFLYIGELYKRRINVLQQFTNYNNYHTASRFSIRFHIASRSDSTVGIPTTQLLTLLLNYIDKGVESENYQLTTVTKRNLRTAIKKNIEWLK